ncbi:HEAT repeat domain-containing protein [Halobacteriovorax sp. DPLXC-1]|uniref:HEAT repeat domain-containing protein n=1 Tax=Halobacteriovorax sp. DPLXC-1 TaxID=3110771 RepID=UPI002FF06C47
MKKLLLIVTILASLNTTAAVNQKAQRSVLTQKLERQFKYNMKTADMDKLKKQVLKLKGKSVAALINVMKSDKYPDKNRWMATFLLGRIMGKKSAPFISKFTMHPNWVMRMAALKSLLALGQTEYTDIYKKSLKDNSLIVRYQALENVKKLNLTGLAPNIWAMLYDKRNYHINEKLKSSKRAHIVKEIINTIGDLKFEKAQGPLLSMIQKPKYSDIHSEISDTLEKITGRRAPKTSLKEKKRFWSKFAQAKVVIR